MKAAIGFTLISMLVATGCKEYSCATTQARSRDAVGTIVEKLEALPDWTSFPINESNFEDRRRIDQAMREFLRFEPADLRVAAEKYWNRHLASDSRVAEGKLLILNNYLFNLPATVRRDSPDCRVFGGGWWGVPFSGDVSNPKSSDEMEICAPWSVDDAGVLRLTGHFGSFSGPPFQPVEQFDYYLKTFGMRKVAITSSDKVNEIRLLVRSMPEWPQLVEQRALVKKIVTEISRHELDDIRAALADELWDAEPNTPVVEFRVQIVNHYLFNTPASVTKDSPHYVHFGGSHGVYQYSGDRLDLRWPWKVGVNGDWQLTDRFGGIDGSPYRALDEFDYFRANFSRRQPSGLFTKQAATESLGK